MTTNVPQTSAQIYQFPIGGRQALRANREQPKHADDLLSPQAAAATIGGAWYHEAAIQDSKRTSEH